MLLLLLLLLFLLLLLLLIFLLLCSTNISTSTYINITYKEQYLLLDVIKEQTSSQSIGDDPILPVAITGNK